MFRVDYRRPEDLPADQRDFPPRHGLSEISQAGISLVSPPNDSRVLLFMVLGYVLMIFGSIVLLKALTSVEPTSVALTDEVRSR